MEQQIEKQQQSEKQQPSKQGIIIQLAETENAKMTSPANSELVTVTITLNMHECTRENVHDEVDKVFDQMLVNCQAV